MTTNHFNGLTEAETERLALLIEECGEVIQAATKILRHGYESHYPSGVISNRIHLAVEIGHLELAISFVSHEDMPIGETAHAYVDKRNTIKQWLHHQDNLP